MQMHKGLWVRPRRRLVTVPVGGGGGGGGGFDGPAELPRIILETSVASTPSNGTIRHVFSGGDLQAALNAALPGDLILLEAGATWTGNYILPVKGSGGITDGWITVMTDGSYTAEGVRMRPSLAASFGLPRLRTINSSPVLSTSSFTNKWRFIGIDFECAYTGGAHFGLIIIGSATETNENDIPIDFIFDRNYVHANPSINVVRGIMPNSRRTACIENWIDGIHSDFDSQAIGWYNTPGPLKIVNNFCGATGENINSGGGGVSIVGMNPSDIEIRRNHIWKDPTWYTPWSNKNLLEFKSGIRTLIEGNVLENSFADNQEGYCFVLTSAKVNNGYPWLVTKDMTIRLNLMRNIGAGFSIAAVGYTGSVIEDGEWGKRFSLHDNVMIGVNATGGSQGANYLFFIAGNIDAVLEDLSIQHNTGFSPNGRGMVFANEVTSWPNLKLKNNLWGSGNPQITGHGLIGGHDAIVAISGPGSEFLGNVVKILDPSFYTGLPGNYFPLNYSDLGLVGGAGVVDSYIASLSDMGLSGSSAYKNVATDGKDPGADIAAVIAATAGVVVSP